MKIIAHLLVLIVTTFTLCPAPRAFAADVKLTEEPNGTVRVDVGGKPFTVYHFNDAEGRPFVRPYFHPVRAADGTEVTSDQVLTRGDHPHHRSLYVAHGDVNGADHWSFAQKPQPKQRHVKFGKVEGGTIVQDLEWESKGGGAPLLREVRVMRFFAFDDGSRGIDFTLTFTPAGDQPVTFGDTKEAGLCAVRVAKAISDKPSLTNSRGQSGEKQVWGKPAEWCDLSGRINGKPYGVAILDHPSNPRHPARWHARDYGLMTANIFGLHDFDRKNPRGTGDFTIEPGETATFRYRVVIHQGDAKAAKVDEKFKEYRSEAVASDR